MRPVPARVELTASGARWRDTAGPEQGGITANTHIATTSVTPNYDMF